MATIYVPTILRKFTGGKPEVKVAGKTVGELFDSLEANHPGIRNHLMDSQGALLKHVRVFLDDEDVGSGEWKSLEVRERDKVSIITAMAGG